MSEAGSRSSIVVAVVLVVVAVAGNAALVLRVRRADAEAAARVAENTSEIARLRAELGPDAALSNERAAAASAAEVVQSLRRSRVSALSPLADVAAALPAGAFVSAYAWESGGKPAVVDVDALDRSGADAAAKAIGAAVAERPGGFRLTTTGKAP